MSLAALPKQFRHPVAQYALAVLLPAAIAGLPYLYAESMLATLAAIYAAMYLFLLNVLFAENVVRTRVLQANGLAMRQHHGSYALLLRSFRHSETYQHVGHAVDADAWATPPHERGIVGAIEAAIRSLGMRLVLLGGEELLLPVRHGVFWLSCDDRQWRANVEALAEGARLVLVCPETTGGLRWEIELLASRGWLDRTVFVLSALPKSAGFISFAEDREKKLASRKRTFDELAAHGFEVPPHDEAGLLFAYGRDRRLRARRTMAIDENYGAGGLLSLPAPRGKTRRMIAELSASIFASVPEGAAGQPFSGVLRKLRGVRPLGSENYIQPPGSGTFAVTGIVIGAVAALQFNLVCIVATVLGWRAP